MTSASWMNDPALENIDKEKLLFLEKFFKESSNLSQKEMFPFLMGMMKTSKEKNLTFNKAEIKLVYAIMQKYSSPENLEKINSFSKYFQ